MKKLIGCPTGEWAKKLFTLERFENLAYFIDDYEGEFGYDGLKKAVYNYKHLEKENKENTIVIITDTRKYEEIKELLEGYGWIENIHFFNGWKLDINFYHILYADKDWINFENENSDALARQRQGWKKRAEMMAKMIPRDVTSILDIGCGEGLVKQYLPDNIKYYGLDYCKRDDDTIVCDLNKEELPNIDVDLYYLCGVFDYIEDKKHFIKGLKNVKYVLLSKTRNERFIRLDDKIVDSGYLDYGVNAYYVSDLVTDMFQAGYICKQMDWNYKERDEYHLLFTKGGK